MLERWTIVAAPSKADAQRHSLFLKADPVDIHSLIRKFGVLCGRPQKEKTKKGYSHSLYLRGLTAAKRQDVEQFLRALNSKAQVASWEEKPPASARVQPPAPVVRSRPAEESPARPAAPLPPPPPPPPPRRTVGAPSRPLDRPIVSPGTAGSGTSPAGIVEEAGCALNPLNTFESLTVGPFNRFAHAASMAVVSNPGTIYNPLLLHGVPGVGKTHVLMAIAQHLQNQAPRKPVFFTSGPRLARAVRHAQSSNRMPELEKFIQESKALIINDVHLMDISEQNQQGLSSILGHYFNNGKAVVMSSVYPPQALKSMEEALRFQISSGWSVEMKMLGVETQRSVIGVALARAGFESDEANVRALEETLRGNFFELTRWLRQIKALAQIMQRRGASPVFTDVAAVFRRIEAVSLPAISLREISDLASQAPPPPAPSGPCRNLAIFFPQKHDECSRYMMARLDAVAKENGLDIPWRPVLGQDYNADGVYGLPFVLSDTVEKAGADAALVLGPNPGSVLASREREMCHTLDRLFDSLQVKFGWVPFSKIQNPAPYFYSLLEFAHGG